MINYQLHQYELETRGRTVIELPISAESGTIDKTMAWARQFIPGPGYHMVQEVEWHHPGSTITFTLKSGKISDVAFKGNV